jgi:hypothetical protein
MKHLRKFNESWIEDMYTNGRSGGQSPKVGPDGYVDKTTPGDKENDSNFNKASQEFRMAIKDASLNADYRAHQRMIDLLDEHGVDLIKDRRYIAIKQAAEYGKEEVMDVLLDALRDSGEDMVELNKELEEYARHSK